MRAPLPLEHLTISSFDGTPLAVQLCGPKDAPALLMANGIGVRLTGFRYVIERFSSSFRFVSWDYRGLHASGRPVRGYDALSIPDHARDALAVVDHLGIRDFHALGWSLGVQVLLEMQRMAADRTETLVLHNGAPGKTFESIGGLAFLRQLLVPGLALGQRLDGVVERVVSGFLTWDKSVDVAIKTGFLHRDIDRELFGSVADDFKKLDMHIVFEILRKLGEHDASDVLPTISAPTLVIQGTADRMTPLSVAEKMVKAIPGAHLEVLPGGSHYAAVEFPTLMNEQLERFWRVAGVV